MDIDEGAPGWAAIQDACDELYPNQPDPVQWSPQLPPGLGSDVLSAVSIYRAEHPAWHYHYVTFGLSELFEPKDAAPAADGEAADDGADPDAEERESGFGFELTFRLLDPSAADPRAKVPAWPISLLNNLAKYVFRSGATFAPGHHMDTRGPIKLGDPTRLNALAFVADPTLGTISTPNGKVAFVQALGITTREQKAGMRWNMSSFLDLFAHRYPDWLTVLERDDMMDDPDFVKIVEERSSAEGSSNGMLHLKHVATTLEGEQLIVEIGASAVDDIVALLPRRIPHGNWLMLQSPEQVVMVSSGKNGTRQSDGGWRISMDGTTSIDLAEALKPVRGDYQVEALPGVTWRVVPSPIVDAKGNVVETIG